MLDLGEACDDGNTAPGDGCLPDCTLGPGALLSSFELPLPPMGGWWMCMTSIDKNLIGGWSHALVLGGLAWNATSGAAYVERVPLPAGQPVAWSLLEDAGTGVFQALQVVTAPNGDVVVAGKWNEPMPSHGRLWLARLTAGGTELWSRLYPDLPISPDDLELTPEAKIVIAGSNDSGDPGASGSWIQVFDADGTFLWSRDAPTDDAWNLTYTGVTVDGAGTLFVAGSGGPKGAHEVIVVEALTPEGALLWKAEQPPPLFSHVKTSDIVLTSEEALVVAFAQYDGVWQDKPFGLAAFDLDGAQLWSWTSTWQRVELANPGPLVATADGDVLAAWTETAEDWSHPRFARVGPNAALRWTTLYYGGNVQTRDAILGPDGRFHVLVGLFDYEVVSFMP